MSRQYGQARFRAWWSKVFQQWVVLDRQGSRACLGHTITEALEQHVKEGWTD